MKNQLLEPLDTPEPFVTIKPGPTLAEFLRAREATMNDYQREAIKTAIYPATHKLVYPCLGLAGEAGELANKVKKLIRDGDGAPTPEQALQLADEIGDVLWYCAALANDLGVSLADIAERNLAKLKSRQERGTLQGSGDTR